MRYFFNIITLAVVLLVASSCTNDSEPNSSSGLQGTKYIGELTILGSTQEDIVFYGDEYDGVIDILMPGVSFMPGLMPYLDMALIENPLISTDPDSYYLAESQMVVIYDRLPLLNDVIQSISKVSVVRSGSSISVSFDCGITTSAMGDMTVTVKYEGVEN